MIRCERASVEQAGQLVLQTVSLHVRTGEAWAVIGRSGAGKSMLIAAAATAVPLHAGDILVDGRSVRREAGAVRRAAGYVPDRPPDWPGLRASELLEVCGAAAGLRGRDLAQAIERGLALAGLAGRGGDDIDTLDAGRGKRLLVARALVHDPQVLLLDDPFAGLDPAGRRDIERLVDDAHLMGRTVLAAIDDARVPDCFTHLAVLAEGRLVAGGSNDPATFADGRRWRYCLRCPGRAADAERAVVPIVGSAVVADADMLVATIDLAAVSPADVVAAAARAGVPIESAGYEPPWQAQLLEE
ncbi:MAG: ABC transporter ATP-binding protein [Planctomycetes bacterium]|nr:ABC transporter ATP-binding protein [Planctomycetota bacterium]